MAVNRKLFTSAQHFIHVKCNHSAKKLVLIFYIKMTFLGFSSVIAQAHKYFLCGSPSVIRIVGNFCHYKSSKRYRQTSRRTLWCGRATNSWHAVAISFERPNWVHLLLLLENQILFFGQTFPVRFPRRENNMV